MCSIKCNITFPFLNLSFDTVVASVVFRAFLGLHLERHIAVYILNKMWQNVQIPAEARSIVFVFHVGVAGNVIV